MGGSLVAEDVSEPIAVPSSVADAQLTGCSAGHRPEGGEAEAAGHGSGAAPVHADVRVLQQWLGAFLVLLPSPVGRFSQS